MTITKQKLAQHLPGTVGLTSREYAALADTGFDRAASRKASAGNKSGNTH